MKSFWLGAFTSWVTLTFSLGAALYWMKHLCLIDSNSVANGRSLSWKHFPILFESEFTFRHNSARKIFFWVRVTFVTIEFLYERWTKNFYLLDSLVLEVIIWFLYYITRKYLGYMDFYMMLLEQLGLILSKNVATVIWLDKVQKLACLVMWLGFILSVRENLCTLHSHFCWLLKQYISSCTRYRAHWERDI